MKKIVFVLLILAVFSIAIVGLSEGASEKRTTKTGSLRVTSEPSKANVYVDNEHKGETPLTVKGLSVGYHSIKVIRDNYTDFEDVKKINAGKTTKLHVELNKSPIIEPPSCIDSDSGIDFNNTGYVKGFDGNKEYLKEDICVKDDTKDIDAFFDYIFYVKEQYCENGKDMVNIYKCPYGCKNGACSTYPTEGEECADSDSGKDYYAKGIAMVIDWYEEDGDWDWFRYWNNDCCSDTGYSCLPEGKYVREKYCNSDLDDYDTEVYECPNGCKDSACIPSTAKCPSKIDLEFNKKYYKGGDNFKMNVKIFDENGNLMPNTEFSNAFNVTQTAGNYQPSSGILKHKTDSSGVFEYSYKIPKNYNWKFAKITFTAFVDNAECINLSDTDEIYIKVPNEKNKVSVEEANKELSSLIFISK